eukprot:7858375-Karenia_brevis.AAC.1
MTGFPKLFPSEGPKELCAGFNGLNRVKPCSAGSGVMCPEPGPPQHGPVVRMARFHTNSLT